MTDSSAAPQRDATPGPDFVKAREALEQLREAILGIWRVEGRSEGADREELGKHRSAAIEGFSTWWTVTYAAESQLSGLRSEVSSLTQQLQEAKQRGDYGIECLVVEARLSGEVVNETWDEVLRLRSALAESRRDAELAREALRKHGQHEHDCGFINPIKYHGVGLDQEQDCDCGLDAALASPPPPKEGDFNMKDHDESLNRSP